jgi:predicted dehydrogenase
MSAPNLAVLGLFHGWRFVESLNRTGIANLVAAADLDPERLGRLGKEVLVFRDYRELMQKTRGKVDGIIAALPNHLHVQVTEEAAKAGVPLLLEKPIACSLEESEKIIQIVNTSKIAFMVAHHRRFSRRVTRLKEEIDRGRLGKIIGANVIMSAKKLDGYFRQQWRITEGVGGVLMINAIHDIDLLRYLIGEIGMVQAHTTNQSRGNSVEDTGAVILVFRNGAVATLFVTDNSPSPWYYRAHGEEYNYDYSIDYHSYHLFGDKASITYPDMELFSYDEDSGGNLRRPVRQERLPVEGFNVIDEELSHFCAMIRGEAESKVTAEDATESLRIIKAMNESSRSNRAVFIPDLHRR